jgi:hypothetical protein
MTATHRQPAASLVISGGPGTGQSFAITGPAVTIGRHRSSDIQVDDPEVSRQHASITWSGSYYIIEDLGSANGTFVNGERISGPRPLKDGDLLRLGKIELAFQAAAPVPSDEMPTMAGVAAPPGGQPAPPPIRVAVPEPPPTPVLPPACTCGVGIGEPATVEGRGFPWVAVGVGVLILLCLCLALAGGAYWFLRTRPVTPEMAASPVPPGAAVSVPTAPTTAASPAALPSPRPTTPAGLGVTAPSPVSCTRFVSPQGNDEGAGTAEAPWRTLQHVTEAVQPGDTVCFRGGTYPIAGSVRLTRSGTADALITLAAYPGETPILDGQKSAPDLLILDRGVSYMRISGFTLRNFNIWGLSLEGDNHHVHLDHLDIGGGECAVRFTVGDSGQPPHFGPVEDVVLEDSILHEPAYTVVDCTPGPCNRMLFRRLEIYGGGIGGEASFGADGLGVEKGAEIVVEGCYVHDNGGDGIDLNSRDRAGNISGIVVRRNLVANNQLQAIKLWAGGRMESNVVFGQGINPLTLGVYNSAVEVVNNTIAYNMWDQAYSARDYALTVGYPEEGRPAVQLTLVNNVFAFNTGPEVGTPTGIYLGPGVTLVREGHNLFWSREDCEIQADFLEEGRCFTQAEISDGTWAAASGQGAGDLVADPLFVAPWPEANLRLREGSPALNTGTPEGAPAVDVANSPRDGSPDIGAYEGPGGPQALASPAPRPTGPPATPAPPLATPAVPPATPAVPPPPPGQALNPNPPANPARLVFIHHSTGEDWLKPDGGNLRQALNDNVYYVTDTNYGWGPPDQDVNDGNNIGEHTDIGHWYNWFLGSHRDTYLAALYTNGQVSDAIGSNTISDPGGENTVVLFKSCFSSAQVIYGNADDPPLPKGQANPLCGQGVDNDTAYTVSNIKGLYRDLLDYFATRPDKLFVLITTPPSHDQAIGADIAAIQRAIHNWMVSHLLEGYPHNNLAVFDYYNVLTSNGGNADTNDLGAGTGNHHRLRGGQVEHLIGLKSDFLAYPSPGPDNHPTAAGHQKATGEFVLLLNVAYHCWRGDGGCPRLMGR